MAEIATIARPYAEALFDASRSDLNGTAAWLDRVAAIAADPQLKELADNPKVTAEQVMGVISGAAGMPLPPTATNFLATVLDNGRFAAVSEIARQFRVLANAQGGVSDALVQSAFPIGDAELAQLGVTLEKRFGRKLKLSVEQDSSLIGGVRVVVGDEVLDTSVKARLEQMKVALTA
ncbi:F0F1 ATP synthase subunit delta [Variovorax dokdonensis]|uniref:ATP synthase subunit delta n=1 Tax=Variovorax dokdonensis TaxID=344883 RepID=A0ABT7NG50_9BURK|nr:F0F1 ATP synthase subunit delta [Variovorax dokdonensis]MDM0046898.1 F0F1 ATP synthase subunit delta [Variovorax dokdonensis]